MAIKEEKSTTKELLLDESEEKEVKEENLTVSEDEGFTSSEKKLDEKISQF